MPAITTRSGRTGHWIKMRRSPVGFSRPEALNRSLSLVDFIIITFESRFSIHTGSDLRQGQVAKPVKQTAQKDAQSNQAQGRACNSQAKGRSTDYFSIRS